MGANEAADRQPTVNTDRLSDQLPATPRAALTGFTTLEFALASPGDHGDRPHGVSDIFHATNTEDFPVPVRSLPQLESHSFQRCWWNDVDALPGDSCVLYDEGMIAGLGPLAWEPQAVEAVP